MPAAFLAVFLAYPLMRLGQAVAGPAALAGLVRPQSWQIAALASLQALASTALALAIGLPLANVTSRYAFRGRALAQAIVTVPFVLPTVVVALAFRALVGQALPQGLALVVLAHAYVNIAVVTRVVGARWAEHDPSYEWVAQSLGATRAQAFRTVTWPMLRPSILSAACVVFAFSFSSLGIALLLGDSSTRTLETQILRQTSVLLDIPGAAASAVLQLVVVSVALLAGAWASRRSTRSRTRPALIVARNSGVAWAVRCTALVGTLIVAAPLAAIALASVRGPHGWTLDWWHALGSIDAGTTRIGSPLDAMRMSVAYAIVAGLVAAIIGGLAAVAVVSQGRARVIAVIAILPLGISAATLGLGTLLAFGRPPIDLRSSGFLVPIAHSLVAVPLVVAVVAPALMSRDRRLVAAAATLGAGPTRAFITAYGPILRLVMLASAGLACAVSLGEFGAAAFLARAGSPTMPVQIVRLLSRPGDLSYGAAAASSVLLVTLTLALVLVVDRMGRNRLSVQR